MFPFLFLFSIISYIYIRTTNIPATPESARQRARTAARLHQLQMTDPDDRRSRSRSRSVTPPVTDGAIPQPNFLADQTPADLNAPRLHSTPRLNLQPPMRGASAIPANSISLNDPEDPFGFHDGPRHNLALQRLAEEYGVNVMIPPEVQLPANWDAPLQNPMPAIPPMPILPRRGRGRAPLGPLLDISGRQNDPALNVLHGGHIAHREQAANHRAEAQILLQQRQQQQEQLAEQTQMQLERERLRLADLRRHAEQQAQLQQLQQDEAQRRRDAETARYLAWARERQQEAQQAFEEEERQNIEAHHREVNRMRRQEVLEAHTSGGSGSRNNQAHLSQQHSEAARHLALERERQQEAQRTLEEEEWQNLEAYQREMNRIRHQEELEAHTSRGSGVRDHQHSEASAAADYERNRQHENQLRREEEAEQRREEEVNQRTHNNAANNIPPQMLPKGRRPYHEPQGGPEHHYLGPINVECNHCHALHF